MMYEVFIKPGWDSAEIEADSAEEAKRMFAEIIRDNIGSECIEANNLETEDGLDK